MTDDFEARLASLYAAPVELPGAEAFERAIALELAQIRRRGFILAACLIAAALTLSLPVIGQALKPSLDAGLELIAQAGSLTPGLSWSTAAIMAVIAAAAFLFGQYQARRL